MKALANLFNSLEAKTSAMPFGGAMEPETVTAEMIHNEFNHACDFAATPLSEGERAQLERAERLQNIGFDGVPELQASRRIQRMEVVRKMVNKYAISHPLNKVISYEEIERINQKYNLVLRPAGRYKGTLPEKNLVDIERFKPTGLTVIAGNSVWGEGGYLCAILENKAEADDVLAGFQREENERVTESHRRTKFYQVPAERYLSICCPPTDVRLYSYEKLEKGKIVVQDPIVLCPIEHNCFLIVTAWGEEAKEVNEKLN